MREESIFGLVGGKAMVGQRLPYLGVARKVGVGCRKPEKYLEIDTTDRTTAGKYGKVKELQIVDNIRDAFWETVKEESPERRRGLYRKRRACRKNTLTRRNSTQNRNESSCDKGMPK